jgi:hypothetical protein
MSRAEIPEQTSKEITYAILEILERALNNLNDSKSLNDHIVKYFVNLFFIFMF